MSSQPLATPFTQLETLQHALRQTLTDPANAGQLSTIAREQTQLLAALPPRYGEVLLNLLDRLESSALFSEESCSFSQKDLLASLQMWVDKARALLEQA